MPTHDSHAAADTEPVETAGFTRRSFLTTSGAVAAGLALGGLPATTAAARQTLADVDDLVMLDALDLSEAIRRRDVSCVEVMTSYLTHIHRLNPQVNAIIGMADDGELLSQAEERDRQLQRGEYLGWMHGFPQAIKDLADAAGFPSTQAARRSTPTASRSRTPSSSPASRPRAGS